MDILQIKSPDFLKELSYKELDELACDIRNFLIHSISKTGGHLSSNLGVVELTIALHYVFHSPKDKFLFDVGHQSYVHKILTGRAGSFDTLRQYNGLSGFQKRKESIHDVWEAGHAATALSGALGMAIARDLNKENYHVVPIVGDGAMISGMSLEALNHIGHLNKNMIIIFNDNNMSISQNVGSLTNGFANLRTSKSYNNVKEELRSILKNNKLGSKVLDKMTSIKNVIKENVVHTGIFGELNLEYLGPVNGHNIKSLINVLEVAKKHNGPVVVHVITEKGRGYKHSQNDIFGRWHGTPPFDPKNGQVLSSLPKNFQSWSSVISLNLERLAKQDNDILAITPAMITGSKLESFFKQFPERSFDCGIAEEHAMTLAAGLASSGKKPFLSIYSTFLQRSYDQLNHDVARMDLPVVIGVDRAGIVGEDGPTHQGVFDISMMRSIPNIIISQPKDSLEAGNLLYTAFNQKHPFVIRYPRGTTHYQEQPFEHVTIGSWQELLYDNNNKLTIISYGPELLEIQKQIEDLHMSVDLINARFIKPIDTDCLNKLAQENKKIIVYETDMAMGGLSSAIIEYYNDQAISMIVKRIGIEDVFVEAGDLASVKKHYKVDLDTLFKEIKTYYGKEVV